MCFDLLLLYMWLVLKILSRLLTKVNYYFWIYTWCFTHNQSIRTRSSRSKKFRSCLSVHINKLIDFVRRLCSSLLGQTGLFCLTQFQCHTGLTQAATMQFTLTWRLSGSLDCSPARTKDLDLLGRSRAGFVLQLSLVIVSSPAISAKRSWSVERRGKKE